jgi:copper homeostasis protein CutC
LLGVIAGAGLSPENVGSFARETGVRELHLQSAVTRPFYGTDEARLRMPMGSDPTTEVLRVVDADLVRQVRNTLDGLDEGR